MGGVGKTSFATHIAHQLKALFPDGVIWIDMYGMRENPTTSHFAMRYVVNSFYPNEQIPEDISLLTGRYRSVLNSKKVLILLDDVLDVEQIERLIPPSPCSLFITSRTQIVLDSCISFQLNCFEESIANSFVNYLAGNNRLTDKQSNIISELCGNLPLALRVAGSYLKIYADDPNIYIYQLRNERTKLASLKVQNKNVEAVLALSARRLIQEDEELANLWQSLSVCEGLFSLYHVEHIVDPINAGDYTMVRLELKNINKNNSQSRNLSQDFTNREEDDKFKERIEPIVKEQQERFHGRLQEIAHDLQKIQELVANSFKIQRQLEFLAERSLISRKKEEDEPFYYIHELMRPIARQAFNYGGSKTQKKQQNLRLSTAAQNHAKFWVTLVNFGQEIIEDLMYEAIGFVGTQLMLEFWWNDFLAGQAWASANLDKDDKAAIISLEYATCSAYSLDNLMPPSQRRKWLQDGLKAAQKLGADEIKPTLLTNLGNTYRLHGDLEQALNCYKQSVVLSQKHDDKSSEAIAQGNIGNIWCAKKEYDKALTFYQKRLDISREIDSQSGIADSLVMIAHLYLQINKSNEALAMCEESLEVSKKANYWKGEDYALATLADCYSRIKNYKKVQEYAEKRLKLTKKLGNKSGQAHALCKLCEIRIKEEKFDEAIDLATQALELARASEYRLREIQCLLVLGEAYARRLDYKSKPKITKEKVFSIFSILKVDFTSKEELEADLEASISCFMEMFYLAKKYDPYTYLEISYDQLVHMLKFHGNLNYSRGELDNSKKHLKMCLKFMKEMEDIEPQIEVLKILSNIYYQENDFKNLISVNEEILDFSQSIKNQNEFNEAVSILRQIYKQLGEKYENNQESEKALEMLLKELSYSRMLEDDLLHIGPLLYFLGKKCLELNKIDEAIQFTIEQTEIARQLKMADCESEGLIQLGEAYLMKNQHQEAMTYSRLGLEKARQINHLELQNFAVELQNRITNNLE
jgi:tetratricopeptide (TPR) repeat protein